MNTMFWVLVAVTAFALGGMLVGNDSAMEQCQKTHSYEVCFQQLNR